MAQVFSSALDYHGYHTYHTYHAYLICLTYPTYLTYLRYHACRVKTSTRENKNLMETLTEERVSKMNATTKKILIQKTKGKLAEMLLDVESAQWQEEAYSRLVRNWSLLGASLEAHATVKNEALSIWGFLIETAECFTLYSGAKKVTQKSVEDVRAAFRCVLKSGVGMFYLYAIHRINRSKPFVNSLNFVIEHLEEVLEKCEVECMMR